MTPYIPILKAKAAEFTALEGVLDRSHVTPVLEMIPKKSGNHVPTMMQKSGWSQTARYLIDGRYIDTGESPGAGTGASLFTEAMLAARNLGQWVRPVTSLRRSPQYQVAVRTAIERDGLGCAIRIEPSEFDLGDPIVAAIEALLFTLGDEARVTNIDLILDLGDVSRDGEGLAASRMQSCLKLIPRLIEWRSVTVCGGDFPKSISELPLSGWNLVGRTHWNAWKWVVSQSGELPVLSYGDYGISHASLPPAVRASTLAQLRYTLPKLFLAYKGGNTQSHPKKFTQIYDICADLVARNEFRGPEFSWGDFQINEKATKRNSTGSAQQWRSYGQSHHFAVVLEQLASLPSP